MNTDKSVYKVGENVYIQIASVDQNGRVSCDSSLFLDVSYPDGTTTRLSTSDKSVQLSATCDPNNNFTNNPDYTAFIKPGLEGEYRLKLSDAKTGQPPQTLSFQVTSQKPQISISRWSATRTNPLPTNRYPMIITVEANNDYSGTVTDTIPAGHAFAWSGRGEITDQNISWDINLKQGEKTELKYEYQFKDPPHISTFGPVTITGIKADSNQSIWKTISPKQNP